VTIVEETQLESITQQLDDFAERLLDTLYALSPYARTGLMPIRLTEKPASFEKYPQLLLTLLEVDRGEGGVDSAFATWRSQILRKLDYLEVAMPAYQELVGLEHWMELHATLFRDKANIRHLRKSMFGRTYVYLYPRLSLIYEYGDTGKGEGWLGQEDAASGRLRAVADSKFIQEHFPMATFVGQERIKETMDPKQASRLVAAAQQFLQAQPMYFNAVFRAKLQDQTRN
jgi:hypothetical protein